MAGSAWTTFWHREMFLMYLSGGKKGVIDVKYSIEDLNIKERYEGTKLKNE